MPTEQCIGESVPPAPRLPRQPPAANARCKAERSPEEADQHVAGADVGEQQVHGGVQPGEAGEHQEHEEVTQEAQDKDEPEGDGHGDVARPGHRVTGGLCRRAVTGAQVVAVREEFYHVSREITGSLCK